MTAPANDDWNQAPLLAGYNAWMVDPVARAAVARWDGGWIEPNAAALGERIASAHFQALAQAANRHVPELRSHDRFGFRIDEVEYHPAYHELMSLAFGSGLHSLAWTEARPGRMVARAALNYLWNQGENGTACPVTMTFAGVQVMRRNAALNALWEPKLLASAYDPRLVPVSDKASATVGMAMTERQGGSDLRAIRTSARPDGDTYVLDGHKWFCSVPMSDGFFTLARAAAGVTCFFVPRVLPDGTRNPFLIQRLKDKCGNRSNASAEIEYAGTRAWRIGDEGRGIATLIEMAHLTRFDITVASAGIMRAMLAQALHHARHRRAFGRRLVEQASMQNVLADLVLEWQAATLLAFRLAAAVEKAEADEHERLLARILVPVAKYWLCKRTPAVALEAMECLGGNGYVEEAPLARFYREAPVNGIWEGSGNVICLDVLRALSARPEVGEALLDEVRRGGGPFASVADGLVRRVRAGVSESSARSFVEHAAVAVQASLMARHAGEAAADAFRASRLDRLGGLQLGTLPESADCPAILREAGPEDFLG